MGSIKWLSTGTTQGSGGFYAVGWAKWGAENSGIENIYICDNVSLSSFDGVDLGDLMGADPAGTNLLLDGTQNEGDAVIENLKYDNVTTDTTATIPYERAFLIVVGVKIKSDADEIAPKADRNLVAYVNQDNMYVYIVWTPAQFGASSDNSTNSEERVVENNVEWTADGDYDGETVNAEARVNVVLTNGGNAYRLNAGDTLTLTEVSLYLWA
jgi:hypothetical protein